MRKLLLVLTLLLSISTYVAAQNYTEVVSVFKEWQHY